MEIVGIPSAAFCNGGTTVEYKHLPTEEYDYRARELVKFFYGRVPFQFMEKFLALMLQRYSNDRVLTQGTASYCYLICRASRFDKSVCDTCDHRLECYTR